MKPRTRLGQEDLFDLPQPAGSTRAPAKRTRAASKTKVLEEPLFDLPERLSAAQRRERERQLYHHWEALIAAYRQPGTRPRQTPAGIRFPSTDMPGAMPERMEIASRQVVESAARYAWTAPGPFPQFADRLAEPYLARMLERGASSWRLSEQEAVRWCLHRAHLHPLWDKRLGIAPPPRAPSWAKVGTYAFRDDLDWDVSAFDPLVPDPRWFEGDIWTVKGELDGHTLHATIRHHPQRNDGRPWEVPQPYDRVASMLLKGRIRGADSQPRLYLVTGGVIVYRAESLMPRLQPSGLRWSTLFPDRAAEVYGRSSRPQPDAQPTLMPAPAEPSSIQWDDPFSHLETVLDVWQHVVAAADKRGVPVYGRRYAEELQRFLSGRDAVRQRATKVHERKAPPNIADASILTGFQKAGSKAIHEEGGGLIADDPGLGKTAQYVGALSYMDRRPVLVLAIPRMLESTRAEIQRWRPDMQVLIWSDQTLVPQSDVVLVSHQAVASRRSTLLRHPWQALVIDESHNFNNPRAARTQAAYDLADAVRGRGGLVVCVSGTPLKMHVTEVWSQMRLVGRQTLLVSRISLQRFSPEQVTDLWYRLGGLVHHDRADVQAQLPEMVITPLLHTLGPRQAADYRAVEDKFRTWFAVHPKEKRQALFRELYELDIHLSNWKLPPVADHVADLALMGQKSLVFGAHPLTRRRMVEELERRQVGVLDFESFSNTRLEEAKARFQDSSDLSCMVGVLSQSGSGQGHTLTAARTIVLLDLPWGMYHVRQMAGRAYGRLNDAHGVTVYLAAVPNSLDDLKMQRIGRRNAMHKSIVEGIDYAAIDQSIYNDLAGWAANTELHTVDPTQGNDGLGTDPDELRLPDPPAAGSGFRSP